MKKCFNFSLFISILIFMVALSIDRATKLFAVGNLEIYRNYGIAFSLFQNDALIPVTLGLCLLVYILSQVKKMIITHFPVNWVALMLAGISGNLMDRYVYGYVIDWIHIILSFNIADIFIWLGATGLFCSIYIQQQKSLS